MQIIEEEIDVYNFLKCTPETVSEEDIEALGFYQQEGSYPPCFKLSFIPKTFPNKSCEVKITLMSAEGEIPIQLHLPGML